MTDFTLTREQVRDLDRRAAGEYGLPGVVLMENAGRGCAELLMRLNPGRSPTLILCGPGNNGGDGFVIARHLYNRGWPVTAWVFADIARPDLYPRPKLSADAEVNFGVWVKSHQVRFQPTAARLSHADDLRAELAAVGWVVDALFGTGLSRGLASPVDEVVAIVNAAGKPVLAIDIPSGLDCDTGEPLGPCVRAAHTATFVAPKRGFTNPAAAAWTGAVHVIDIGAPRHLIDQYRRG